MVILLAGPVLAFTADLVGFAIVGEDSDGCSDLERSVRRKGLSESGDLAKTCSTVWSRHKQSGAVATLDGELLGSPALYQLTFLGGGRSGGGRDRVISDAAWNLLKRSLLRAPVRMSDKLRDRLAPSSVPSANFIRSTGMLTGTKCAFQCMKSVIRNLDLRDDEASVKTV